MDHAEGLIWAFDFLNGGPSGEALAFSAFLRGGGKNIFIKGVGEVSARSFHKLKPSILKMAGPDKFSHVVGRNPDIFVNKGLIHFKGVGGPFNGKIYNTGLKASDFFK